MYDEGLSVIESAKGLGISDLVFDIWYLGFRIWDLGFGAPDWKEPRNRDFEGTERTNEVYDDASLIYDYGI